MNTGQVVGKWDGMGFLKMLPDLPAQLLLPSHSSNTCVNTNSSGMLWEKLLITLVTADHRS